MQGGATSVAVSCSGLLPPVINVAFSLNRVIGLDSQLTPPKTAKQVNELHVCQHSIYPVDTVASRRLLIRPDTPAEMGTTLSPFRYIQLARYVLSRWIEHGPAFASGSGSSSRWKGKGKAKPLMRNAASVSAKGGIAKYALDTEPSSSSSSSSGSSSGSAAPSSSRTPLTPDPRMPAQSTEIYRLMNDPRLLERSRKNAPREIIVLCHGELLQYPL